MIIPSEQYSMFLGHLYEKTSKASAQPQAEHAYDREEVQSLSPATMHDSLTQVGFHAAEQAYVREEVQRFSSSHDA